VLIQGDQRVMQPIPDTFCLSKNKLHWNHKTKNNVILSVGNVHHVQQCMYSLFSSCLVQPSEEFLHASSVMEMVHQTRYCRFVWHRRIGKCIPKLIPAS
jgi:hypothetical protein